MEHLYKIPLVLAPQPEGGYTVTSPLLPELITEADTLDELVPNVQDAVRCHFDEDKMPRMIRLHSVREVM